MISNKLRRPLFIYDSDCQFCRLWVNYSKELTGAKVDYASFQKVADNFPEVPRHEFAGAVKLIFPDGTILSGAHATFGALAYAPGRRWLLWMYGHIPGFGWTSEVVYRFVASHRDLFYRLTRWLHGKELHPATFTSVRWLFFRLLGVIYLIAFFSFGIQAEGLIGSEGILPVGDFLEAVRGQFGTKGYWLVPTLFWLNSTNAFLESVSILGVLVSLILISGFFVRTSLIILFLLYLSLVSVGQVFMSFQWDILLLEVGFLAILLSFSTAIVWLFRLLLFKFVFLSGAVKLLSGDPTWRNLTALTFHYETQPLPTSLAWYMHQLPLLFHQFSTVFVFFIQLVISFLLFGPRRLRFIAASSIIFLEVLIALTGNYNFFNILTIALCILVLDDRMIARFIPQELFERIIKAKRVRLPVFGRVTMSVLAFLIVFVSTFQVIGVVGGTFIQPARFFSELVAPFRIVNTYGLFAVMTTVRNEIEVHGSYDGETWSTYEFKYKPDLLTEAPRWVAPHQPRLDWQMWFAALGPYQASPWFLSFVEQLLKGSPPVLALLEENPFSARPPQYVRALLYEYRFTDFGTRSATGAWWSRELLGLYLPPVSLR